ncbi:hypothetical protein [Methylobacterium mesophilicum]
MSSVLTVADQDAGLRKALEDELVDVILGGGAISPRALANQLIAGPLATLRSRATSAEDRLRDREAEIERLKLDRRRVDNRIRAQRATLRQFETRYSAIIGSPAFSSLWSFAKKKAADCRSLRAALASTEPHASSEEATDAQ